MAYRQLFRHPVGYFPARARWYLAGASTMALLLVAAHLAVQAHTQDVAQATVTRWLKQSGGSVEQVRFHLLRNALTLDGVHFAAGGISVDIPEVLLYARVDTLLGGHPRLSRVSMSAPRLRLPSRAAMSLLALQPGGGKTMFHQIWRRARRLDIHGGTLVLVGGKDGETATLEALNLSLRQRLKARTVRGTCRYHGEPLTLSSRMHRSRTGTDGVVDLRWDGLDGRDVAPEVFGLAPLDGEISGQARWSWRRPVSGPAQAHAQGEMHIASATAAPSLGWHARRTADGWQAQFTARAWPLAPMRGLAPTWGGRTLSHGALTGDAEVAWSDRTGMRLRLAQASIRDLDYVPAAWSGNAEASPGWHVDRVDMTDARLDAAKHVLSFGQLSLLGGEVRLLSGPSAAAAADGRSWHVQAKAVAVDDLALGLVFADGRSILRTPPLSGHVSWFDGSFEGRLAGSDAPVSWHITGQGRSPDGGMHLDVRTAGLPLIQLRPLLPFVQPLRAGTAVQLDGRAGASLAVDVRDHAWTASGKVEADAVTVAWQGVSLQAKHLAADLEQVGSGAPVQAIRRLQVSGWQYQGALQPLTATANPAAGKGGAGLPFRRSIDWRIDAMDWQDGAVSFGRADAVWARDVRLQLMGWQPGQQATVTLSGKLDGGQLQATGSIGRIDGVLRTKVRARVSSARPFFLNAWLQVSGAPRVIRGRWASRFSWRTDAHGMGHGHLRLWLHRWRLETGAFPHDPFLGRTGFAAHDLLRRLHADHLARIDVQYTQARPGFAWPDLGDALLAKLREQANAGAGDDKPRSPASLRAETRIRLHGRAGLSYNERVRLRKLWRRLISDRRLVLDMIPQMERQDLDAELVGTIRHTQDMIVRFMTDRGIPPRRLFPVWPTRADRGHGSLGIRVEVLHP